ncbi:MULTISPECIES: hypothetical protein [Emticicia]|uniref:hypothetical protein n=1 Tax=Emticicia TaxID=312278 RepID=UPI0007D8A42E|nr:MULTISPECIES: hypothetical protein [Emticicia]
MKKDSFAIYLTTLFVVVYCLFIVSEMPYPFIMVAFLVLHVMVIWMVYAILKSKDEPKVTFDEKFYLDASFKPTIVKKEINKKSPLS